MSDFTGETPHRTPPALQEEIVDALVGGAERPFADRCKDTLPIFIDLMEVAGEQNIPRTGPLVVVKNHPTDFDSLTVINLFECRPDLRLLVTDTPPARRLPSDQVLFLRKDESRHAHPDDIAALQAYLRGGGSIMTTAWGTLDQRVRARGVTAERAARNTLRSAEFAGATVLSVCITIKQTEPFRLVRVDIGEPIVPNPDGTLKTDEITAMVTDMYDRFVVDEPQVWSWIPGSLGTIVIHDECADYAG